MYHIHPNNQSKVFYLTFFFDYGYRLNTKKEAGLVTGQLHTILKTSL